MTSKSIASATILFSSLVAVPAHAAIEFARGSLVFGLSEVAQYDSNIFGSSSEKSDEILITTPSLTFSREAGLTSALFSAGLKIQNYSDHTSLNSNDAYAGLQLFYDAADKGEARLTANYARNSQANDAVLARTESDDTTVNGSVLYNYSEKLDFRVTAGYSGSLQILAGYNDVTSYQGGIASLYRYSPKLKAVVGYNFRTTNTNDIAVGTVAPDSTDHRITFGLEGEFTPLVTGRASFGIQYRDFTKLGSDSSPYADVGIAWQVRQKTSLSLSLSNDYSTTAGAQSALNTALALGVTQNFSAKLTGVASVSYGHNAYAASGGLVDRNDDVYTVSAGLSYKFNTYLSGSFNVSHLESDSDLAAAVYGRTVLSIGLSARY